MAPRRLSCGSDTLYPKLDLDDLLSEEAGDNDSEEESLYANGISNKDHNGQAVRQRTKEEEDVEMFLVVVDRMSVRSILFLLQNHAREMLNIPERELKQALLVVGESHGKSGLTVNWSAGERDSEQPKPTKKFRFAEIMGGSQIRVRVRDHLHISDISEDEKSSAWWTCEELSRMKRNAARIVRHYEQHRADFIKVCNESAEQCEKLAKQFEKLAKHGEKLASDSIEDSSPLPKDGHDGEVEVQIKSFANEGAPARGLETHMCYAMREFRDTSIERTLDVQDYNKRRFSGRDSDGSGPLESDRQWKLIRQVYVKASRPSVLLAQKMAQADHIQALKAIVSPWTTGDAESAKEPIGSPVLLAGEPPASSVAPTACARTPPAASVQAPSDSASRAKGRSYVLRLMAKCCC